MFPLHLTYQAVRVLKNKCNGGMTYLKLGGMRGGGKTYLKLGGMGGGGKTYLKLGGMRGGSKTYLKLGRMGGGGKTYLDVLPYRFNCWPFELMTSGATVKWQNKVKMR